MKNIRIVAAVAVIILVQSSPGSASGPVGLYGIIERVVFEPDAASAERIQVWGVFAYADGRAAAGSVSGVSAAERGYLYFTLPAAASGAGAPDIDLVRREWADLSAVAGTGRAVAFGRWQYFGSFAALHPSHPGPGLYTTGIHVRPASEPAAAAGTYRTNAGIVLLSDRGSHAAIVAHLRERLGSGPEVKDR